MLAEIQTGKKRGRQIGSTYSAIAQGVDRVGPNHEIFRQDSIGSLVEVWAIRFLQEIGVTPDESLNIGLVETIPVVGRSMIASTVAIISRRWPAGPVTLGTSEDDSHQGKEECEHAGAHVGVVVCGRLGVQGQGQSSVL